MPPNGAAPSVITAAEPIAAGATSPALGVRAVGRHRQKRKARHDAEYEQIRSTLSRLRNTRSYLKPRQFSAEELAAEHEQLHHDRAAAAERLVLPHLQEGLELLAVAIEAVSVTAPDPAPQRVLPEARDLARRQESLASLTVGYLVTDKHTWSAIVEAVEEPGWADSRVRHHIAQRRRVGEILDCVPDEPRVRKAATAVVAILEAIAAMRRPVGLSPGDTATFEAIQQHARARIELVKEIQYKAEESRRLVQRLTAAASARRGKALRQPPPAPASPAVAIERRRRARREARAHAQRVRAAVTDLSAAYTMTSSELRALDWRELSHELTRGASTEEVQRPGFPKAQVRNLFGLLKLVRGRLAAGDRAPEAAAAVLDLAGHEESVRTEVCALLEEHRPWLPDDGQVIGWLGRLHLGATIQWTLDHWDAIDDLVAQAAPREHGVLEALKRAAHYSHAPTIRNV